MMPRISVPALHLAPSIHYRRGTGHEGYGQAPRWSDELQPIMQAPAVGLVSTSILRLSLARFTRVVKAPTSSTFNDHIGQPSPINANNEFGLTMAATQNRRINGITLKCDRAVRGSINEAMFWIAFDNAQENSALHALFPRS